MSNKNFQKNFRPVKADFLYQFLCQSSCIFSLVIHTKFQRNRTTFNFVGFSYNFVLFFPILALTPKSSMEPPKNYFKISFSSIDSSSMEIFRKIGSLEL